MGNSRKVGTWVRDIGWFMVPLSVAPAIAGAKPVTTPAAELEIVAASRAYQHLRSFSASIDFEVTASGPGLPAAARAAFAKGSFKAHENLALSRPNLLSDAATRNDIRLWVVCDGKRIYAMVASSGKAFATRPAPKTLGAALAAADLMEGGKFSLSMVADMFSEKSPSPLFTEG